MKKLILIIIFASIIFAFKKDDSLSPYQSLYHQRVEQLTYKQMQLLQTIQKANMESEADLQLIREQIAETRSKMKAADFWLRYLEPLSYKKINGPLPVEWETEVFEKFEKPYRREGAGLTLAALALDESKPDKAALTTLVQASIDVMPVFEADSITNHLSGHHHFFLCNRLFLLNLATIYTTGFENPDTARIIPELDIMLKEVEVIYQAYLQSFATFPLSSTYTQLFESMQQFVQQQPVAYAAFDHFTFLQQYVNPLFLENQRLIKQYGVVSKSYVDYSLTKNEVPIFSKRLYNGQNAKGVFLRVQDPQALAEIDRLGKLLFFDPILSANNERSCASCHNPAASFADHASTSLQFNGKDVLPRNTPSLINAGFNHLLMADGKHITLLHQAAEVTSNPQEMASNREEVLKKILSCKEYKKSFTRLLVFTPQEKEINLDHIFSAIASYYSKFNYYEAPFDAAMNERKAIAPEVQKGFNLFMSKAQCATCHFAPIFNGVKPPYVGSEFEVLGVPADTLYTRLSKDKGRYGVNPADETLHAFRTGTIRNAALTAPYMHNGVFGSLDEVLEFYNRGGGAGRGLDVANQTLSRDSLGLTETEKKCLIAFINLLNELIPQEQAPGSLPQSSLRELNKRKPGGSY